MDFVGVIVALHRHLADRGIAHAFGGALALGYVAAPRGTVDIDVNVFVTPEKMNAVADAVAPLGYVDRSRRDDPPIAGKRFEHVVEPFPVDFFPSLDADVYGEVARRVVLHEFGRDRTVLPFLSAEDLSMFKLSFGRPQDWVDLAAVAAARPDLDVDYVERQLIALRGPTMYPRVARFRGFFRKAV